MATHPSLTIYKSSVKDFIYTDFEIETLADDCNFTEGPLWNEDGFYLFSDIPEDCIYQIRSGEKKKIIITNSGGGDKDDPDIEPYMMGSNALAYDHQKNLLVCQHGSHQISKWNGKELEPWITHYQNKPFNSPNDLIMHSDGTLFFSDPPYGLKNQELKPKKYQSIGGVYYYKEGDEVELFCDKFQYPNGVCLSPDEKIIYICSTKDYEKHVLAYNTSTKKIIDVFAKENSDGIKCDHFGNVYLSSYEGIIILNKKGERLALIKLPATPANHCFGGREKRDLFITAKNYVMLFHELVKRA